MTRARATLLSTTIALALIPTVLFAQTAAPTGAPPAPGAARSGRPAPPPKDPLVGAIPEKTQDWLMWGHDQQRSAWANSETELTKENVGKLKLLWSAQLSTPPRSVALSTLTSPVVIGGVQTADGPKTLAFVVGADDTIFAIDADAGKVVWQKTFKNPLTPVRPATWLCSNAEQATPVIDKTKGVIYFTTSDGNLRAAALGDGAEKMAPTKFVAPFSRNWSLNLINGKVYTTTSRGCGGDASEPIESGNTAIADVSDPTHATVQRVYTGRGRPAGSWSRSGVVRGPQGVYEQTADGLNDPASGMFGSSILSVDLNGRGVTDSFTPQNWKFLNAHDLDLGSGSPIIFPFKGHALITGASKEAVVYLLDANALGGGAPEHSTPLFTSPKLANDDNREVMYGVWGAQATYENQSGNRYVYLPVWGPQSKDLPKFDHSYGTITKGAVEAFQVNQTSDGKFVLQPSWTSVDMAVPDAPVVANGVVYDVATGEQTVQFGTGPNGARLDPAGAGSDFRATPVGNETLYAFDAETGKELYSSKKLMSNWDHFNEPVVAYGKVFVVSYDAHVYAFGLKGAKR